MSKKKLTICIPTYNRLEFLKNQISFFQEEFKGNEDILRENVEFIIGDNASTDNTAIFLKEIVKENDFFQYVSNKENLGLIGNVTNLLGFAKSEFIWFVSDDDTLIKGVVLEILNIINNNKVEFVYLNFSADGEIGNKGQRGYINEAKAAALAMFKERYGSLVFITSCIYKRETLLELEENPVFKLISAPLLFSFYSCSKGSIYVTEKVWVNFRTGNASYASFKGNLKLKFEQYISILETLPSFSYDKIEVRKIIESFLESQSVSHLLFNFYNFKNSIKLYKYYNTITFLRIPVNIKNYIFKKE